MKNTEEKISELLSRMTLDEKINCCHAASKFSTAAIERLGIPKLVMSDGPHGVREEISANSWDVVGGDDDYSTYLPTGTALAATWSVDCARLFGEVLGSEARERGKDVILGPGVNIVRNPLCGRNFEYYGEDPYQVGTLAVQSIEGIQSQGTAACVKHYALNSQELQRMSVNARCDERTLREIYLPAFEAAVKKGHVMTVMGAFNRFNGQYACQNDYLLNQILKQEWEFDGLVISDWGGVLNTFEAARGGMDLEMGTRQQKYSDYFLADPFRRAVENGEIDECVLDDKVRRYLRTMFKIGLLGETPRPAGERNTAAHQAAARRIASEAIVLLKNDRDTLPFDTGKIKKLLVVGENAVCKHHLGGNSSSVKSLYEISPLEGLQKLLFGTGVEIEYIKGYPSSSHGEEIPSVLMGIADEKAGTRGWVCNLQKKRNCISTNMQIPLEHAEFDYDRDLPPGFDKKQFSGSIQGTFTPDRSGKWTFYVEGISQTRFCCSNTTLIENCKSRENITGTVTVELEAGKSYELSLLLAIRIDMPFYPVHLTAHFGEPKTNVEEETHLMQAAKQADAVLFFGGLNHTYDCEGADRKDMKLHNGQNELIEKLSAINPNFAVILAGGSPSELPWAEKVPAIIQMWYAGMEGGNAISDVLFGRVNPSGKLPFTFPETFAASPVGANGDYGPESCDYRENVFVGYRWFDAKKIVPRFPFGYGLSYTSFELKNLKGARSAPGILVTCTLEITNTGKLAGAEVVQLYVEPAPVPGVARPVRELKGFSKVFLNPGETKKIVFQLDERAFQCFHPVKREWYLQSGSYVLRAGTSSVDLPLRFEVKL